MLLCDFIATLSKSARCRKFRRVGKAALWVVADGFRTIPFVSEAIVFTLLDFIARVGFAGMFAVKATVMDASRGFVVVDGGLSDV